MTGARDLIVFRCDGERSAVCLSMPGTTTTEVGRERAVITDGLEALASLSSGQSFERDVTTDRGMSCRVRWTHVG